MCFSIFSLSASSLVSMAPSTRRSSGCHISYMPDRLPFVVRRLLAASRLSHAGAGELRNQPLSFRQHALSFGNKRNEDRGHSRVRRGHDLSEEAGDGLVL